MAYRQSSQNRGGSGTPGTAVPGGAVANDIVLLMFGLDSVGVSVTSEWPTGFVELDEKDTAAPADTQETAFAYKRLTGTDSGSYTLASLTGGAPDWICQAIAFSGRHTTNPPVISTAHVVNTAIGNGVSVTANALTAVAGDDLAMIVVLDPSSSDTGFSLAAPSGWSLAQNDSTRAWSAGAIFYKENVSAGDTGTISSVLTTPSGKTAAYVAWLVRIPAAAVSEITGTASITEANDTLSAAGALPIIGTLTNTETNDTLSSGATLPIAGTLSTTEISDTVSSGATLPIAGVLSKTEAADTLAATGTSTISGVAPIVEANDTLVSSATIPNTGALTKTEASDTLASTAVLPITGTLSVTELNDAIAASSVGGVIGAASITEASDTLAAAGTLPIVGTLAKTEANDTLLSSATLPIIGGLTKTETSDTLTAVGTSPGITGIASIIEANDTLSAAGTLPIIGTLTKIEAADTLSATGTNSSGISIWSQALTTGDLAGYGNYSNRMVVPVTGITETYLVLIADQGAVSAIRYVNGLASIPNAGGVGYTELPSANTYNSAADNPAGGFDGIITCFNALEIRGSGAGRQLRARVQAPAAGSTVIDNASVGVWPASPPVFAPPNICNTASIPIELLWGGVSGIVVANGATAWSDWISFAEAGVGALTGVAAIVEANDTLTATSALTVVGALTKTEASDTISAIAVLPIAGVLSKVEANDTVTAISSNTSFGTVALTEANDTVSATGTSAQTAAATITEANDTLSSSATLAIAGTLSKTEADDTATAIGINPNAAGWTGFLLLLSGLGTEIFGVATITEANDTLSATGGVATIGTLTKTEANDTLVSASALAVAGTLTKTEANDSVNSAGTVAIAGTLSKTKADDTLLSTGSLAVETAGVLDKIEANDTLTSLGTLPIVGVLTKTEDDDTSTSVSALPIVGVLIAVEESDTAAAVSELSIAGALNKIEDNDTLVATGAQALVSAVITEADDTVSSTGTLKISGSLSKSEANDTVSAIGEHPFSGQSSIIEDDDTLAATGVSTITGAGLRPEANDTLAATGTSVLVADASIIEANDTLSSHGAQPFLGSLSFVGDDCCPPDLCGVDLCGLLCSFINLLPSGPMWDYWKASAISHFQSSNPDLRQCEALYSPDCPSLVQHAIYTAIKLYDLWQNALFPAVRESDPNTAVTTLDDWLERYRWEDCFRQHCRSVLLGTLTPFELPGPCGPIYCDIDIPEELNNAVKRGIIIALTRANMGVIKNLAGINWVIEPLSARVQPRNQTPCEDLDGPEPCAEDCCQLEFEIVNFGGTIPGVYDTTACNENTPRPKVPASINLGCDVPAGLPETIWPGVVAAECIVRSMLPLTCGTEIKLTRTCVGELLLLSGDQAVDDSFYHMLSGDQAFGRSVIT